MGQAKKSSVESKLLELEKIVSELESEEIDLEESIKKFEKGVILFKDCKKVLGQAEQKIKVLTDSLREEDLL